MTAEEKLKELYKREEPPEYPKSGLKAVGEASLLATYSGGIYLAAEHVDLIANLVIERLKNDRRK